MKPSFPLLALPSLALAFPRAAPEDKRQLLGQVDNLLNDVSGLLGSVASSINPDNYRPEPGYDFKAPGPGDSRGPCPGLNLLANHVGTILDFLTTIIADIFLRATSQGTDM